MKENKSAIKSILFKIFYSIIQLTWGIIQSSVGFFYMLKYRKCSHMWYHGSYVTFFSGWSGGISLGLFVFVADVSMLAHDKKTEDSIELAKGVQRQMLVHEYGHTIQSLMFGPLYFFVIGIPSVLWGTRKKHDRYRKNNNIKYTSYWTEKWANNLGEKITGEKAWDK